MIPGWSSIYLFDLLVLRGLQDRRLARGNRRELPPISGGLVRLARRLATPKRCTSAVSDGMARPGGYTPRPISSRRISAASQTARRQVTTVTHGDGRHNNPDVRDLPNVARRIAIELPSHNIEERPDAPNRTICAHSFRH